MNGAKSRDGPILDILAGMTAKMWKQDSQRIRALLGKGHPTATSATPAVVS